MVRAARNHMGHTAACGRRFTVRVRVVAALVAATVGVVLALLGAAPAAAHWEISGVTW